MGTLRGIDDIIALYAERGSRDYGGEAVTQAMHALQCAALAERSGAGRDLVAAAFLHDIAHLLGPDSETALRRGEDLRHEVEGALALKTLFPPAITEPIRLHVAAKRYLVATDRGYAARLSDASRRSLLCQGGPFGLDAAAAFENEPHAQSALALRRFDDGAKDPEAETPDLEHVRAYLVAAALRAD